MSESIREKACQIQSLSEKYQECGYHCGDAVLRAFIEAENIELPQSCQMAGRAFFQGSGVGDRCGVFAVSLMIIGLLYGRRIANFAYQYDRELARRLNRKYKDAFGTAFCTAEREEKCECEIQKKIFLLLEILQQAKEEGMEPWSMKKQKMMDKYYVDERLQPYAPQIMREQDWELINAAGDDRKIDKQAFTPELLEEEYRRGVLNKREEDGAIEFYLGAFPRRIDCCMRGERALWDSLSEEVKNAFIGFMQDFDVWVFPELEEGEWEKSIIMPVEEVIAELEKTDNLIYLQDCDCRIYGKEQCGKPIDTCIHWPDSLLNTPYDRGYARKLSREEAIANVIRSDQAGLIHCMNSDGNLCNCCTCCCWAFKGLHTMPEKGYDPKKDFYEINYVISLEEDKCVNCGLCVAKCQFGALQKGVQHLEIDQELCYGCGVCRVACRKDALVLKKLDKEQ